jgi:hypothetical protein
VGVGQRILDDQYRKMLAGSRTDALAGPAHPASPATLEMRRLTQGSLQARGGRDAARMRGRHAPRIGRRGRERARRWALAQASTHAR